MQDHSKKIKYGAMMLALFTILLAGVFFIPLIGLIVMFFLPLPIILYRLREDRKTTSYVVLSAGLLALLLGGPILLPFALVFGILGFLIAESLLLGKSKLYIFMSSGLVLIIVGILTYLMLALFFEVNIMDSLMAVLKESENQFKASLNEFGALPEGYENVVAEAFMLYRSSIPAVFILSVYAFAFIMVIPNLMLLRRLGHNVPKFPPFHQMKLPVITIFIYGLFILLPFVMKMTPDSSTYLLYINATIILRVLLLLQGLSLVLYFMYRMKLPGIVTFFSIILALLFNPITILLGILDIGVNIRAWIKKDNSK
ncbi:DUF2232 domain-containing protein [Sporosarcina thermotolerans]|uniref:DUF2232 domain-containing protein n=1 Tax=Sporosarcina thermotolerans TaxID=633404 RepID=A0AAW9A9X7_9BACL|nr:DUF2232 domain-containing protein [Sporosarcina thermotolerans]MDW0116488.1 DUF2232 domain-containing protein [Sporosarcina thermotolerans]WHT48720.1 DUF2232 domain-containing protein [Sporosarcina thermotolerans]